MPHTGGASSEEEGEIVEDEQTKAEVKAVVATKLPPVPEKRTVASIEPPVSRTPAPRNPPLPSTDRKREGSSPTTNDPKRRRVEGKPSSSGPTNERSNNDKDAKKQPHDVFTPEERKKELSILLREPSQVRASDVLLNFNYWLDAALKFTWMPRVSAEDVQDIFLSVLDAAPPSDFVEDWGTTRPTKICVVLAKDIHPDILAKTLTAGRKAKQKAPPAHVDPPPALSFFETCSSLPCSLSSTGAMERNAKIKETPLSPLLARFPSPTVDLEYVAPDTLFGPSQLELTILAQYTTDGGKGWTDELIVHPAGHFFRKTTNQSGDWRVDGDLLHLRWKSTQPDAVDKETSESITSIDVLQADDESMRRFRTSEQLDATYAPPPPADESTKPKPKRQLRLTVLRGARVASRGAAAAPPLSIADLHPDWTATDHPIEYYLMSDADRAAHQYPMDVVAEQAALLKATQGQSRDVYVSSVASTLPSTSSLYAIDCEMCETVLGSELTRVTLLDATGDVVYDQLVKPHHTIVNYHTEFSGITAETLADVDVRLADVQAALLARFVSSDVILVGHSIDSDLRALRLVHARVVDTAVLFPHARGFPFKPSLKMLAATYLGAAIQTSDMAGHDSSQDALAALQLFQLKRERGPTFGLPAPPNESDAYETIAAKCPASTRLGVYGVRRADDDDQPPPKPWTAFASGAWGDLVANTRLHVDRGAVAPLVTSFDALAAQIDAHAAAQDVLWVELDHAGPAADARQYMDVNHVWRRHHVDAIVALDAGLAALEAKLPPKTLLVVVPQAALGIFRHMRGCRLKSRWGDGWDSQWTDKDQENLQYALCGVLDSVAFFKQTTA
ncbi:Aste57867_17815 [Aphanomyces stellatus]|uniref:Aste57867_17815 protein n=1 Tax=Aphanomyces stellatus TaxID=120398 RepID=A0A485L9D9_9STRA|nr:hypothetical protein As57867_017754 [Aphanomyces stellatus]VFT94558.1 Aste57867_17815 [Aphanomyces stellatus]